MLNECKLIEFPQKGDERGQFFTIMAGASAVELCSVIYQRGNQAIADMTNEMTQWMNRQGYKDISEFKNSMNALSTGASNPFERTQFMKYFSSKE